jgi:hypothetical protein
VVGDVSSVVGLTGLAGVTRLLQLFVCVSSIVACLSSRPVASANLIFV